MTVQHSKFIRLYSTQVTKYIVELCCSHGIFVCACALHLFLGPWWIRQVGKTRKWWALATPYSCLQEHWWTVVTVHRWLWSSDWGAAQQWHHGGAFGLVDVLLCFRSQVPITSCDGTVCVPRHCYGRTTDWHTVTELRLFYEESALRNPAASGWCSTRVMWWCTV